MRRFFDFVSYIHFHHLGGVVIFNTLWEVSRCYFILDFHTFTCTPRWSVVSSLLDAHVSMMFTRRSGQLAHRATQHPGAMGTPRSTPAGALNSHEHLTWTGKDLCGGSPGLRLSRRKLVFSLIIRYPSFGIFQTNCMKTPCSEDPTAST